MNELLEKHAREMLKTGLKQLPEKHQHFFKRMYSHGNLEADIENVVDSMPEDKLDWAMTQVQRSLDSFEA